MKFIEAIKAMGPGQLLINPAGAKLELRDGFLCLVEVNSIPDRILFQDKDGWQVIDKPRPCVKFADAMRAALDGKVIKSVMSQYKFENGVLVNTEDEEITDVWIDEIAGDWEIIEPEGDK